MQTNSLGYNILSDKMSLEVFGEVPTTTQSDPRDIMQEMSVYGVEFPIRNSASSNIPDFNLPKLKGSNISEHFKNISTSLLRKYIDKLEAFLEENVEYPPKLLSRAPKYRSGWTRFSYDGSITQVDEPCEEVFVFDCETFVKGSNFGHPIIGTCVSHSAYYLWLHPALIDASLEYAPAFVNLGQNKIVIAHNAAFDHCRVHESYLVSDTNKWIDTMSMHINVCGLASGQRFWFAKDNSDESDNVFTPKWSTQGSLNSLVDCYNYHCAPDKPLSKHDKSIRNVFVDAEELAEIRADLDNLILYAFNDVYYTLCLFNDLYPKYAQANPSLTTLWGHMALLGSFLPLDSGWDDWVKRCDKIWEQCLHKQNEILSEIALDLYESYKHGDIDIENDPWLSQMDWEVNSKLKKNGQPASKWYGIPKWLRDISSVKEVGQFTIEKITTKQRISHLLLRLKWNNQPIQYSASLGWCFAEGGQLNRIPHSKTQDANVGNIITKDYLEEFETGVISSDLPQAQELLNLSINVSYWTSVRSRAEKVVHRNLEGFNAHAPEVVPHNTSTNRAGCNLWFTVPGVKKQKIGSEIKTLCRAPAGYKFVQADYDKLSVVVKSL
jgi:DNA polymerase gamma 1